MKVLLINPEFLPSFWSLRETCDMAGRKTLLPPLGLLTVAALLPQEWEFRLADLNTRTLTPADWDWAELVVISGMIIQREGVLSLIRQAKQQGKTTAVGGPYATSLYPEVLEAGADFLLRGEGEVTIPHFLGALREGQPGGVFEEEGKPDLTASPVPRFDLVNIRDYLTMGIQTSRGCPFDCEFCDIVNLYGRKPRYKNPGQVLKELETLYRLGWRRDVFISDDNFIGNKGQARSLLAQLIPWMKSHGEPFNFWTQTSVNLGQDLELIDLMTAANFSHVFLGVESPEPELLAAANKHQNLRNPLRQSLANINANGLSMVASFVLGFDQEKPGTGDRISEFVEELGLPLMMLNLLQPLPNTRLWERLQKENRLLERQTSGDFYALGFNYRPTRPPEEILWEYVRTLDGMYEPSRYLDRTYRYYLKMRPTRRALARQQGETLKKAAMVPPRMNPSLDRTTARQDLEAVLRFIWRHGVRAPYRGQFWKQLWSLYRQNPSRLKTYILACLMGENLFQLRRNLLERWAEPRQASPKGRLLPPRSEAVPQG
jgi:radical SAM superfamily enzyme YgiQ (UPF0313 family)